MMMRKWCEDGITTFHSENSNETFSTASILDTLKASR